MIRFGPGIHRFGHIVNKYTTGDRLVELLKIQGFLIGCEDECRTRYFEQIDNDTNYDKHWTFRAHNEINRRIGKKVLSLEEADQVKFEQNPSLFYPGIVLVLRFLLDHFDSPETREFIIRFRDGWIEEMDEEWAGITLLFINSSSICLQKMTTELKDRNLLL